MIRVMQLIRATAKSSGWEAWQAILEFVKSISEVILSNLPSFWRIGKSYMEGKFKKVIKYF
jgi:exocyst complex component 2